MGPAKVRRAVVEVNGTRKFSHTRYTRNKMNRKYTTKRPEWRIVERKTRGDAGVIVSELPLPVPRYSFRVGTAKYDEEIGEMYVTPYLTVFNAGDAYELLAEISEKYIIKREEFKDELDAARERWEHDRP